MGVIATHKNKMTLYYHPEGYLGSKILPYVESSEKKVLTVDLSKTKVTGTQWAEIAEGLGVSVGDLVDEDHKDFREAYGTDQTDLSEDDWISVLQNAPQTLVFPILIKGEKFYLLDKVFRFTELTDPDSAGLKKPYNK